LKKGEFYAIICLDARKGVSTLFKLIKSIPKLIGVLLYVLYIVSLTSNISNGKGEPILNYVLLAVSVVFLLIYVIMLLRGQDKKQVKSAKRYFKWFKLGMKGVSLFIIIYGFVTASSEGGSMFMPSILIALWIMQVNLEIMKHRARKRRERMKAKFDSFTSKFKKAKKLPSVEEPDLTVAPVDTLEFINEDF